MNTGPFLHARGVTVDNRSPEDKEDAQHRRAEVMRLRRTGMTFEEIGTELGISKQAAWTLYKKTLASIPALEVSEYRAEQAERLDALLARANEVLAAEHITVQHGRVVERDGKPLPDHGPILDAIKAVLDIEARRAKLLGLDTPVKQSVEVDGGIRYEIVGVDVSQLG